jgi:glycosyltransferase involved in cell wall biosynthesis
MGEMSSPSNQSAAFAPDVSVVVCTYNRADFLRQTLASLLQQTLKSKCYEIIVVDDGSSDHTAEAVEDVRRGARIDIRYIRQANSGIGNARNRGYREARAPWVAYIDDDELASEHWLSELLDTAEATSADCVGGPSILRVLGNPDIQPVGTIGMLLGQNPCMVTASRNMSLLQRLRARITRLNVPGGGNVLVRKALLERLGGFRPLRHGEDLDFFRRAVQEKAGLATAHQAIIYHLTPAERLTSRALYSEADRGGRAQATIDRAEFGVIRPCGVAALRIAHMIAFTIPALVWHRLMGNRSHVVSKCCSLRYALAYMRLSMSRENAPACSAE